MARPSRYTEAHIEYVKENILTRDFNVIAKHIGCASGDALRKQITTWRKQGHDIPLKRKRYDVGELVTRTCSRRGNYQVLKTETGYKYHGIVNAGKPKEPHQKKGMPKLRQQKYGEARQKKPAGVRVNYNANKPNWVKPWLGDDRKVLLKNSDTSGKIGHKIDSKTIVYMRPGKDINQFVAQLNKGRVG